MTVRQLKDKFNAQVIVEGDLDRQIDGCYCGDLLSWVISKAPSNCCWFTIMSNVNVSGVAALIDCACVVMCEGVTADKQLIARMSTNNINLLSVNMQVFDAVTKYND